MSNGLVKRIIIFLPLVIVIAINSIFIYYTRIIPPWPVLPVFNLLNILATLLMVRDTLVTRVLGIVFGILSGVFMWRVSLLNWKLDLELYAAVLFIGLYLFIGIYFLCSHLIDKLKSNNKI